MQLQTPAAFSFSAYFAAAAFSQSAAFACGCEDCDPLICPLFEPLYGNCFN
jgi:hypothetical protein